MAMLMAPVALGLEQMGMECLLKLSNPAVEGVGKL